MREFYTNLSIVDLCCLNLVISIRGKEVHFKAERINGVYGLDNVGIRDYYPKDCDPSSWQLSIDAGGERSHKVPLRLRY